MKRSVLHAFGFSSLAVGVPLLLLPGILLFASPIGAQEVIESEEEVVTPQYRAYEADVEPDFGTYTYDVSWNGISAAEGTITVDGDGATYQITATARTYSPINLFYNLKYRAVGLLSALDMTPQRTVIDDKQNSQVKRIEISFEPDGKIRAVRHQEGKPNKVVSLDTNNFTLDPFGAAFLARTLKWEEGETKEFDTFNGQRRYVISLTATGHETVRVNGVEKNCWVIVPKVRRLPAQGSQPKLRDARIYMTDDRERTIVKIVSSVFVGSVTTKLVSYVPSPKPPMMRLAMLRSKGLPPIK